MLKHTIFVFCIMIELWTGNIMGLSLRETVEIVKSQYVFKIVHTHSRHLAGNQLLSTRTYTELEYFNNICTVVCVC